MRIPPTPEIETGIENRAQLRRDVASSVIKEAWDAVSKIARNTTEPPFESVNRARQVAMNTPTGCGVEVTNVVVGRGAGTISVEVGGCPMDPEEADEEEKCN